MGQPRFTYHNFEDPARGLLTIKLWDGDEILGTIMVRKGELLPPKEQAEPHTRCWQVAGVDIVEQHRRKGFATKLYEEAARIAGANGLALCSDIPGALDPRAEAFWEKQVRKGRAKWEIPGGPDNEDRNYDFGRYVLKHPPPGALGRRRTS